MIKKYQNTFISGEIAPTLRGRTDIKQYSNAIQESKNCIISPHGGIKNRQGLLNIHTLNSKAKLFSFEYSTNSGYLIAFEIDKMTIIKDEIALTELADFGTYNYTVDELFEMDIIQSADTIIITHENHKPLRITRESDMIWHFDFLPLKKLPVYNKDNDSWGNRDWFDGGITQLYLTSVGDTFIVETLVANVWTTTTNYTYNNTTRLITLGFTPPAGTEIVRVTTKFTSTSVPYIVNVAFDHPDVNPVSIITPKRANHTYVIELLDVEYHWYNGWYRPGNHASYLPTTVAPPNTLYISQSRDYTWSAHPLHIVSISFEETSTDLRVVITTLDANFISHGYIGARGSVVFKQYPYSTYDEVFSDTLGYPQTCTFHQNRLWFGGSKSFTNTVFGSVVRDFFNFDIGTSELDDGIVDTIKSDKYDKITNIVSGQALIVTTIGAEWARSAEGAWSKQTQYGAKRLRPIILDSQVYYIDRYGKNLRAIGYQYTNETYESSAISFLCPHLLNDVRDLIVSNGSSTEISNYIYIINGDGTIATVTTLKEQNIGAFTEWNTDGEFVSGSNVLDNTYFLVKRDNNYFIEKLKNGIYTDHTFLDTNTDRVIVDSYLQNKEIRIVADDKIQQSTSTVGNEAIADRNGDIVYAGIQYTSKITTLTPHEEQAPIFNSKKRIRKVILFCNKTDSLYVDNKHQLVRNDIISTARLGYSRHPVVEIEQKNPISFEILQLDLEVVL